LAIAAKKQTTALQTLLTTADWVPLAIMTQGLPHITACSQVATYLVGLQEKQELWIGGDLQLAVFTVTRGNHQLPGMVKLQ
jgi:hypothetical protein